MITVLICLAVVGTGFAVMKFRRNGLLDGWESALLLIGATMLSFIVMALPIFYLKSVSFVNVDYPTIIQTLGAARNNTDISPIELAAIQTKVLEANQIIADAKYWGASPFFNWFYPRSIMRLEPIK
jgi:hypothetical protein